MADEPPNTPKPPSPPVTPPSQPEPPVHAFDLAKFNFLLVVEWIKFADTKATTLLTITLALFGLSLTEIPLAAKVMAHWYKQEQYLLLAESAALHVLFYVFLVLATLRLLSVVRSRLVPKTLRSSLFFFQTIANIDADEFMSRCRQLQIHEAIDGLNDQVYNNATVARQKYESINWGILWLVIGGALGLLAALPVMVQQAFL